jgi:hypothetical protein
VIPRSLYVNGRRPARQPARRNVELKRIRVSSIVLRWVLAVSLTASPLLAEYPPQSPEAQARQREAWDDIAVPAHRPAVRVVDENNDPLIGTTIFSTLLTDSPAASAGQLDTQKSGKELGIPNPSGNPDQQKAEPGGKTLQEVIIAALIAGGIVALILLLGGHHKKPAAVAATSHTTTPPPPETGTVLVSGTPTVSSH